MVTSTDRLRFQAARARGAADASASNAVITAAFNGTDDALELSFRSGASIAIPRACIPQITHLSTMDASDVDVSAAGDTVFWRRADIDISVAGLVRAVFLSVTRTRSLTCELRLIGWIERGRAGPVLLACCFQ